MWGLYQVLVKAGVQVGLLARTPGHPSLVHYSQIRSTKPPWDRFHHFLPEAQITASDRRLFKLANWDWFATLVSF